MSSPRPPAPGFSSPEGFALPVLLLPGFLCDARAYAGLIGALSRQVSVHVANLTRSDCVEALATHGFAQPAAGSRAVRGQLPRVRHGL